MKLKKFGKDFNLKKVKNFLSEDERKLLEYYTIFFHRNNNKHAAWDGGQVRSGATSNYADTVTDALLKSKVTIPCSNKPLP